MSGRRSHPRFAIATSAEAVLRVLRDVTVERVDESEIIAISRDAGVVGEQLKLDTTTEENRCTKDVRIVESRPIVIDGTVRHRLRLANLSQVGQGGNGTPAGHAVQGGPRNRAQALGTNGGLGVLGVLTREIDVRVINCSASGCLIESRVRLEIGAVVTLRLFIDGREFVDEVQLVRCQAVEGAGSVYYLGAQHLWVAPPGQGSLRLATQYLAAVSGVPLELGR